MFTSRAEFRLHLRIDNADRRLTRHGRRVGLISNSAWEDFLAKQTRLENVKELLEKTKLTSAMLQQVSGGHSFSRAEDGTKDADPAAEEDFSAAIGQALAQLLKRPEITIERLAPVLAELAPDFFHRDALQGLKPFSVSGPNGTAEAVPSHLPQAMPSRLSSVVRNELKSIETEIKYEGYLLQQQRAIDRLKKAEQRGIPEWFDYRSVSGLSREMQEKLTHVRPRTLGHASRIPGVTPAAVSLVHVFIEIQGKRRERAGTLQS